MTCTRLSDRTAEVARGGTEWTGDERRHLASCADCAAEFRLVQAAVKLAAEAPPMPAERISDRVIRRLAAEPVPAGRGRWWWGAGGLAAAAALLWMLWPGSSPPAAPVVSPAATALVLPLTELDSLDSAQLRSVLESLDDPLAGPDVYEMPSMLDLDDTQLERVLRSLEG